MRKMHVKALLLVLLVAFGAILTKTMIEAGASADSLLRGRSVVKVKIKDNLNIPVPDASLQIEAPDGRSEVVSLSDLDGNYVFRLSPGTYSLMATAPNYITETQSLTVNASQQSLTIYLSPEL